MGNLQNWPEAVSWLNMFCIIARDDSFTWMMICLFWCSLPLGLRISCTTIEKLPNPIEAIVSGYCSMCKVVTLCHRWQNLVTLVTMVTVEVKDLIISYWKPSDGVALRYSDTFSKYQHYHCKQGGLIRAPLIGGPQVAWMLQASWGRSGKQEQEQNSPNLGPAY